MDQEIFFLLLVAGLFLIGVAGLAYRKRINRPITWLYAFASSIVGIILAGNILPANGNEFLWLPSLVLSAGLFSILTNMIVSRCVQKDSYKVDMVDIVCASFIAPGALGIFVLLSLTWS